jgi:limonene-1,2-epoxide hydrolase
MDQEIVEKNLAAARKVCEQWNTMTAEEFAEVMAPDCDYRNIPIDGDRHVGPEAAHAILSRFAQKWDVTLKVDRIAATETTVLTERTEHFEHRAGTKDAFDLPVMGAFDCRDGKITAWRDYFDVTHLKLR